MKAKVASWIKSRYSMWFTKFSEIWTSCMIMMVQGDLSALTLKHAITASKTGSLAATAVVIASIWAKNDKYTIAFITGVLTMVADIIVHPTHFGPEWAEAACTGLGAAILSLFVAKYITAKG